jgi:signal transduction histidine kinase
VSARVARSPRTQLLHWTIVGGAVLVTAFAVTAATTAVAALIDGHWQRAPLLALMIAPLVVIALMPFVRRRADRLAERLAYGERAGDYAQMSAFVTRMANTLSVDDVLPRLAETAAVSAHGERGEASVWLDEQTRWTRVWPADASELGPGHSVEVFHAGSSIGEIGVGATEGLASSDLRLLDELAGPAGLALSTVRLTYALRERLAEVEASTAALRASQERLVAARRDERSRLRADVEESIVPSLEATGQALRVNGSAPPSAATLTAALDDARSHANDALAALRRLARGIVPPQLHLVGPAEALDLWITESGLPARVHMTGARTAAHRDPASEAALFFCCATAVSAFCRGDAAQAAVELAAGDAGWAFSVVRADEEAESEVEPAAELAMRDRVEALGGELLVSSDVVEGTLPGTVTT